MKTITRAAILFASFALTYSACDARDARADGTCAADLARADASLLEAQRAQWEAFSPQQSALADVLVASAVDRKRTALALCADHSPVKVSPFEADDYDPFAADEGDDSALAYAMTLDLVGVEGWATP